MIEKQSCERRCRAHLSVLLMMGLMATAALSDVVVNRQGRPIEGQVVRETTAQIVIQLDDGSAVHLPRAAVRSIERAERWINMARVGDYALARGDHSRAEEAYEQALQSDPPEEDAARIREQIAAVQSAVAVRISQDREDRMSRIDEIIARVVINVNEAEWPRALADLDAAEELRPSESQEAQMRTLRIDSLYGLAYSQSDRLDNQGAMQTLQQLFAIEPREPRGLELFNRLIEDEPLDNPEAVAEIEAILERNPDNLNLQARLGEYYSRRHDYGRALPHLMAASQSDLQFAQIGPRLKRALEVMVDSAVSQRSYEEAIQYYEQILELFPHEDENYLNVLIYYQEKSQLADDDLDGHVRLAIQCQQAEYDQWAREQMDYVLSIDPNHPGALELNREFAEAALEEAMASVREENYTVGQMLLERFIENYNYPDLNEQATLALADAQRRVREAERQRQEQAERLVERADEYFATAQMHISAYQEQAVYRQRTTVMIRALDQREQILLNLRRAVDFYDGALRLNPALGPPEAGDVWNKRSDAADLLRSFTGTRIPTREPGFSRN